jgi:DNA invertase Pin-like site-specific DNA recombinase
MRRTPRPPTSPASVVVYLRVSTEDQNLGPDAQRAACARWAAANGARIVSTHEDLGVSGAAPLDERPGLLAAVEALKAHGAGVLLVAKRDRLARDVVLAAMVERLAERHGARILAADGTGNGEGPEAQLMRGIVDVFAQYERALIRARTKAALAVKRTRGEKTGGAVPYGSRIAADGVHLEADPDEAAVVARARALRAEGLTLRAVAARLEAEGFTPRGGGRWHPQTVANIAA